MKSEEKFQELANYIEAVKNYYIPVLLEEKNDYNNAIIKGKLNVLNDITKMIKKLEKVK
ncbi:hypothetical protein [Neobacillus cucumis]|uniref:hypothetical protein n=1 Tax=Neobacillus cucumis TaxID=1740721 RepID=UPI0019639C42|nr:hypothetical protein [Neobacillus cucumis]MBM7655280.1 hypothetical protein [Neobacillus cucumis]MED4229390.1 hypothetical protein [Neobacillus cucumis]